MSVRILLDDNTDGAVLVRPIVVERSTSFRAVSPTSVEAVIVKTSNNEAAVEVPLLEE